MSEGVVEVMQLKVLYSRRRLAHHQAKVVTCETCTHFTEGFEQCAISVSDAADCPQAFSQVVFCPVNTNALFVLAPKGNW